MAWCGLSKTKTQYRSIERENMKNTIKATLIALAVAGAASGAQAATYNSDLIIGFSVGSGNDFEYDLGAATALTDGETWSLATLLNAANSSLNSSTVNWGVIGDTAAAPHNIYVTKPSVGAPSSLANNAAWSAIDTPTKAIYSLFGTAGAGQNIAPSSTLANSWNQQTIVGGTGKYKTAYINPNTTGYSTVDFWKTVSDSSARSKSARSASTIPAR